MTAREETDLMMHHVWDVYRDHHDRTADGQSREVWRRVSFGLLMRHLEDVRRERPDATWAEQACEANKRMERVE